MTELAYLPATEIARLIAARELSAVEVMRHHLARVDQFNPALNAVVVDARERGLLAAARADAALAKGQAPGVLHGVPMTVKESYNLAGFATTWGNPAWRENIAAEDAVPVARLEAAGATVFGKTNVPISLADFQSYNEVYGTTNNPYDLSRVPGGSSGGSAAALAAGLSALEIGSDIGGSIRNPAHYCGVFGHKPTWNLLWNRGHSGPGDVRAMPDISVIGPLARSAVDLEAALRILAEPDPIMARGYRLNLPEFPQGGLRNLRIALWREDAMCPVSADVSARLDRVARLLEAAGAEIDDQARPDFSSAHSHSIYQTLLQAAMAARMPDTAYTNLRAHVAHLDPADDSPAARVFRAQVASHRDWLQANEARHKLRWQWHRFFERFDIVLMPVMSTSAFPHDQRPFGERCTDVDGQMIPYFDQVFWAGLAGVAHLPSTVIPTGPDAAGLPIGVQIVGPEYGDLITLGVARELETAGCRFLPPPDYA